MRRGIAAAAIVLATIAASVAAPPVAARADDTSVAAALAASADRTCSFEFGGRDEELRDDCSRRLSAWWDEILDPSKPAPAGWDETKLGPWSLVARTSGGGFVEERPGFVHVMVNVVAEGLPSRMDAADALMRVIVAAFEARVRARADALTEPAYAPARQDLASAQQDADKARSGIREIVTAHGGPPERRADSIATLLNDAERDASRTRIDRAVTAKKLDAARAAAERATELVTLRRDADDLERRAASARPLDAATELTQKLAALRTRIDELAKTSPPLDAAREQVFRLEVDLVGLEARAAVLVEELKSLREEGARVQDDAQRHADLVRELSAAQSAESAATARIKALATRVASRGPVFQVIRAPGPPSKKQEEKR